MRTNKDREALQTMKLVVSKMNLRYSLRKGRGNGRDETYYIKVEILPPFTV